MAGEAERRTPWSAVYESARPDAVVAPLVERLRAGVATRVALLGGGDGERRFLAQRLADELGLRLLPVAVPRLLKRAPRKVAAEWDAARRARGLLLLEDAGVLFAKDGGARAEGRRAGETAARLLRDVERRQRPVLLSAGDDTSARLAALAERGEAVVRLGAAAPPRAQPVPRSAQCFRVEIGGIELACSHVGPLVSEDVPRGCGPRPRGAPDPGAGATLRSGRDAADVLRGLVLRRAVGPDDALFAWRRNVAAGGDDRRDVRVHLLDRPGGEPVVTWELRAAWPARWSGPTLDALDPHVAEEEVELRFERLAWIAAEPPRPCPEP